MIITDPLGELLKDYAPVPGGYDEMLAADGSVRPHWRGIMDNFAELSTEKRAQAVDSAVRMLRENDVAYTAWSAAIPDPGGLTCYLWCFREQIGKHWRMG